MFTMELPVRPVATIVENNENDCLADENFIAVRILASDTFEAKAIVERPLMRIVGNNTVLVAKHTYHEVQYAVGAIIRILVHIYLFKEISRHYIP